MLGLDGGVLKLLGRLLGSLECFLRTFREPVESHQKLVTRTDSRLIYRPMIFRRYRWLAAGTGVAVLAALVATAMRIAVTGGHPHEVLAASVVQGNASDLRKPAWYQLSIVSGDVAFTGVGAGTSTNQPAISASSGILVDIDTKRILWQFDPRTLLPPASTVKMLTALVVLDNYSPDRKVTATADALRQAVDETKLGMLPGQTLTVRELLTAMLLASANDAASVLAYDTVGLDRFVGAMNAQAAALGLTDMHVASPVGLDDPGTRASAYDLAVLAATVFDRFPLFRDIVGARSTTIAATSTHPAFVIDNNNGLLQKYAPAVGIKPGWTGDAGACEVGMAVRDGHRLIDVLMRGTLVYTESARLLDWGFTQEGLPPLLPPQPTATPR